MSSLARSVATRMLAAAARLLPPNLSPWASAMARELLEVPDDREALLFAAGCIRAAAAVAVAGRLRRALASVQATLFPPSPPTWSHMIMNPVSTRPRLLGLICGAGAVGMGMAYMLAAGAPSNYPLMNFAALVLGAAAWLALGRTAGSRLAGAGPAVLALAAALLLTAWFGVAADGAVRWVKAGPFSLQVSLIVLPVMIVLYARRPDPIGTAGMIAAAVALAVQPDRAMAGVLLAALLLLLSAAPGRLPALAAAAAALAFGWTLVAPDILPASAFVDQVFYTAFDVHPLAGAAVVLGAAALILPAAAGLSKGVSDRSALLAFGGCWLAVVAAAALGNYPTPLVGYGGSAVLGYLLSVSMLPASTRQRDARAASAPPAAAAEGAERTLPELRAASPA